MDYTNKHINKSIYQDLVGSVYKVWVKRVSKKQTHFKVNLKLVKYKDLKVEFDITILRILYISLSQRNNKGNCKEKRWKNVAFTLRNIGINENFQTLICKELVVTLTCI